MDKKAAPPKPILGDVVELVRDLAAEGLHGVRLGKDLGGQLLDVALGAGTAEEVRAGAAESLIDTADALRRAVAANLALARRAVVVQGRALDLTAALLQGWLTSRPPAPDAAREPEARPDREARRARLATLLQVVDGLRGGFRGAAGSTPAAAVPPRPLDATLRVTPAGGSTTIHLMHPGPDEVRARFHVGPCAREDGGASFRVQVGLEPEELTLRPQVEEPVRVSLPFDARFEPGATYRLPIVVAGLGAQVVVRVVVAGEERA